MIRVGQQVTWPKVRRLCRIIVLPLSWTDDSWIDEGTDQND